MSERVVVWQAEGTWSPGVDAARRIVERLEDAGEEVTTVRLASRGLRPRELAATRHVLSGGWTDADSPVEWMRRTRRQLGARLLASNDHTWAQAFELRGARGIQFHPELDAPDLAAATAHHAGFLRANGIDAGLMITEIEAAAERWDARAFEELVLGHLRADDRTLTQVRVDSSS